YANNGLSGDITLITDQRGVPIASNTYDENGRVTKQVRADSTQFVFSYKLLHPLGGTSPGLETTATEHLGRSMVYRFNPEGFLIAVTDSLGQLRNIVRDGAGQIVKLQGAAQC